VGNCLKRESSGTGHRFVDREGVISGGWIGLDNKCNCIEIDASA